MKTPQSDANGIRLGRGQCRRLFSYVNQYTNVTENLNMSRGDCYFLKKSHLGIKLILNVVILWHYAIGIQFLGPPLLWIHGLICSARFAVSMPPFSSTCKFRLTFPPRRLQTNSCFRIKDVSLNFEIACLFPDSCTGRI